MRISAAFSLDFDNEQKALCKAGYFTMILKDRQDNFLSLVSALLISVIVCLLLFRGLNLTPDLINKHSWGEAQYAMWARSYIKEGLFLGIKEVNLHWPLLSYIPVASILAAGVSKLFYTNLVFTGRVISFLFSLLSVFYFYKIAFYVFNDRLKALISTLIFVIVPINMYYSGMFYNDPLHLFFIIHLTYLLFARRNSVEINFYYSRVLIFAAAVLFTKPTTAVILGPPILFLYYVEWEHGRFDKRELLCLASALIATVLFFGISRVIYSAYQTPESGKFLSGAVLLDITSYFNRAWKQLSFQFQNYHYVFIAALPVAAFSTTRIRFFFFMSLGFLIFYFLFIKSTVVHQYYSLPFVLPFSIISAYGIFKFTEILFRCRALFAFVTMALLLALSPDKISLYYVFRPEYSKDLLYVVETVKRIRGKKNIFVSAKGYKIFQYYLNIPYKRAFRRWERDESIVDFLERKRVNVVILKNHKDSATIVDDMHGSDFGRLYCSSDYLVYVRNISSMDTSECKLRF